MSLEPGTHWPVTQRRHEFQDMAPAILEKMASAVLLNGVDSHRGETDSSQGKDQTHHHNADICDEGTHWSLMS